MTQLKIFSPGTGHKTVVIDSDGHAIPAITAMTVTFKPDDFVRAVLTIDMALVEVEAVGVLDLDTTTESARYWGFRLVPIEEG